MKDYALEIARAQSGTSAKLNCLREYLQAYLLRLGHDQGLFRYVAFVGGTALRFLYGLPRFSEDIDLSLLRRRGFSFEGLIQKTAAELRAAGYQVSVTLKAEKTVQRAMVRFEDLLYEAGISPARSAKLSMRLEIDTRPPQGATLTRELVNKFFPIAFLTYDVPSLFAGKLNALLSRRYAKGRDYFDLAWYLSHWRDLTPNILLLKNSLKQMGWKKAYPTSEDWREVLFGVVAGTDWRRIVLDVERFLERPSDMKVFTKENVLKLVRRDTTPL